MRRVFRTRHFSRWMRKTALIDWALCAAVSEMERGLVDADLLKLFPTELDESVESETLKEICHGDQD